jgi:catechol 2,3-dioxygenase-like lactoylglutathione lyase family enzyme
MKRLHVHLRVDDLARSIDFYAALFGTRPSLVKRDYAKWQLDDPRANFTLSKRAQAGGLDHLGIQVEDDRDMAEITGRLADFGVDLTEQQDARCCYARSDKAWARDPQGIAWETFLSHGESEALSACGDDGDGAVAPADVCCADASCATPAAAQGEATCCA